MEGEEYHGSPLDRCLQKQERLVHALEKCATREEQYLWLMQLGKQLPPLPKPLLIEENRLQGCQSTSYVCLDADGHGMARIRGCSEALISAGLIGVATSVFQGEPFEVVCRCPLQILNRLNFSSLLSMGRMQGWDSLLHHLRLRAFMFLGD